MPPQLRLPLRLPLSQLSGGQAPYICLQCRHASLASAITPTPTLHPTIAHYPPTQPPSHKPPEYRKSQLHRQYQSLLRSSPLILLFQHNNLKATEWSGIRRELSIALRKIDDELAKEGKEVVGAGVKLQIVRTGILASALNVVEFWEPKYDAEGQVAPSSNLSTDTSAMVQDAPPDDAVEPIYTHGLSRLAWSIASRNAKATQQPANDLTPLLSGPLALLTFPTTSPQHLAAALSILAPTKEFPAPKRKVNAAYHEKPVQDGIAKLMLLGARVEGRVMDMAGARWVGGIKGGMEGLRAQLVGMLSGVGAQVTTVLEAPGRTLWVTVEGRRGMLEEEEKHKGNSEEQKAE
ncbi:hypothetical protein LTR91_017878 [Friedmanniomyces endolithicus]|uniref:Uncharacterized protein n=1 Tax=Friedmanniomyces endolithicus TaxID=329885 RepID=A0AAN6FB25_9PEZI|nr:hypothetical protein LTS00_016143 [Friedmanniomyces endolithicus]KAK0273923.1 hypothetical protein LTR35_012051 [Friedmanniomyces endolithicus]KAK0305310.1 hypothetical protein LTR01_006834 [Friedmanniomyces endolithicus]KAK0307721.1 hypothetical protein LTR82_015861 [Friedmanniomyces endolithicus]KAK0823345.1 hypothetical protein LTR73_008587 [Friedmanniomyces endolithicus]